MIRLNPAQHILFNSTELHVNLFLKVIRIMDSIWNREGLDLRMMPYACLATGSQVNYRVLIILCPIFEEKNNAI